MHGAIGAHGQAGAQRLLGPLGAQRDRDHLALPALLLDPERLLHRELVVGGYDPGDPGGVDGATVPADLHLGRGVGDLLDHHEDFHSVSPLATPVPVVTALGMEASDRTS